MLSKLIKRTCYRAKTFIYDPIVFHTTCLIDVFIVDTLLIENEEEAKKEYHKTVLYSRRFGGGIQFFKLNRYRLPANIPFS